jgi:hypothetical protein
MLDDYDLENGTTFANCATSTKVVTAHERVGAKSYPLV